MTATATPDIDGDVVIELDFGENSRWQVAVIDPAGVVVLPPADIPPPPCNTTVTWVGRRWRTEVSGGRVFRDGRPVADLTVTEIMVGGRRVRAPAILRRWQTLTLDMTLSVML